jgi:DNA polymerase III epsilon subunit-like protein
LEPVLYAVTEVVAVGEVVVLPVSTEPLSPVDLTTGPMDAAEPNHTSELQDLKLQLEALALQPLALQRISQHAILGAEERVLSLRYLQAQCHGKARLQAQGYTVGIVAEDKRKRPSIPNALFRHTPVAHAGKGTERKAVVLDCEMVQVANGRRELAYVTAVDFLSGEVLLDHYVQPTAKVVHWDSRYSGVTCSAMNKAVRNGQALLGYSKAREMLWRFVDTETVLIGHSLNNDLDVLGIIHPKIVDTSILTSEAVFNDLLPGQALSRTWSLKTLTKELAGYDIQAGKQGHSAFEDTMATRDILIWCIRNQKLWDMWSAEVRGQEKVRALEREIAKLQAKLEQEKKNQEESRKERHKEKLEFLKLAAGLS